MATAGCGGSAPGGASPADPAGGPARPGAPGAEDGSGAHGGDADDPFASARATMVRTQLVARDITDQRVLAAMGAVPRHHFVPPDLVNIAYADRPLPIGHDATISQPYIVALMTQLAQVEPGARVLDVGTGSGYQAAVLAEAGATVYGIEIVEALVEPARERLVELGHEVEVRHGDGWAGWSEHAPYDAIIVAAAPEVVPKALREQLAVGGRLVLPVGRRFDQRLIVVTRTETGFSEHTVIPVAFVPMTGEAPRR